MTFINSRYNINMKGDNMNERVREVRKKLGLTLEKFGSQLGVSKVAISRIENGINNVTEQMCKSICREFNVNETWLRTGKGEMFIPQTQNQEIIDFANRIMSDEDESFRKRFVSALAKAKPEFWDDLERIVDETLNKD